MSRRRRDSSEEFQEYMGDLWDEGEVQHALKLQRERDERNGGRKKKPKQEQGEATKEAEVPKACDTDAEVEERESRIRELYKKGHHQLAMKLREEQDERVRERREKSERERREAEKKKSKQEQQKAWEANEKEWDTESEAESSGVGTSDEEDPEGLLDEAKEVQTKEEEKVHAAAAAAAEEIRNEQRRVGDIRGEWSLYSSEWLEEYVNEPGQSLNDYDWSSGVGTIRFSKHLIGEADAPWAGDMGMRLEIQDKVRDASPKQFNKPKYASLDPETLTMYNEWNEGYFSIKINFLGDGYLEMRMGDVYFAGIHVQGRQAGDF